MGLLKNKNVYINRDYLLPWVLFLSANLEKVSEEELDSEGHAEVKCAKVRALDCSPLRAYNMKISGLPPMKNGSKSMWANGNMAKRLVLLRKEALKVIGDTVLSGNLNLNIELYISNLDNKTRGDLDNFITGICDGLQVANNSSQKLILDRLFEEESNKLIHPLKRKFIEDDKNILRIQAKINLINEESYYILEIYEE